MFGVGGNGLQTNAINVSELYPSSFAFLASAQPSIPVLSFASALAA